MNPVLENVKTRINENYNVRKAEQKDVCGAYELLCNTSYWLKEKGISQWEEFIRGEGMDSVREAILSGITYMVEDAEGEMVAIFNLSDEQNDWDIKMWGIRTDGAYYLHKLAVAKAYHHKQIGRHVLNWVDTNIALENGCVRLDCVAENNVLNQFYQRAGYRHVGYYKMEGQLFSKYEKSFRF